MSSGHPEGELRWAGISAQISVECIQIEEVPELQFTKSLHTATATGIHHLQGGVHSLGLYMANRLRLSSPRAWPPEKAFYIVKFTHSNFLKYAKYDIVLITQLKIPACVSMLVQVGLFWLVVANGPEMLQ